jgi:hypothetical protein
MPVIDPTTAIGKVRLRVGDYFDLPIFPDAVYQSTLDDNDGNVVRTSKLMAQYILGTLTMRVHEKLAQIEVYGNQFVDNYIKFLNATILNPHLMSDAPIPYAAGVDKTHPIIQFQEDWNNNYSNGTSDDQLHLTAIGGTPNGYF